MSDSAGPTDGPRRGDGVGSVAEEAAKLLDALRGLAGDQAAAAQEPHPSGSEPRPANAGGAGHLAGGETCSACPVCRGVAALRQASPEVRAHLAVAASSLLQAAAALLEPRVPPPGAQPTVERIDLDDPDGTPEADWEA